MQIDLKHNGSSNQNYLCIIYVIYIYIFFKEKNILIKRLELTCSEEG